MKQLLLPSPPLQKLHARHRTSAQCICNCDQQLRHTYEISVPYATFEIGIVWRLIYSEDADTDKYFHLQFNRCTLCRMDICIIEVVPRAPQPDPSTSYIYTHVLSILFSSTCLFLLAAGRKHAKVIHTRSRRIAAALLSDSWPTPEIDSSAVACTRSIGGEGRIL